MSTTQPRNSRATGVPARRDAHASRRAFVAGSAAFGVAGMAIAVTNAAVPFSRGWWLVAYLILVGALSQLLLGVGQLALAARAQSPTPAGSRPARPRHTR